MISESVIKNTAKDLGFDLVGITNYQKLDNEIGFLQKWLDKGYHAKMEYMNKNLEKRYDPQNILPNCQTIISLALNYYQTVEYKDDNAKISKYALGKDYHYVIWDKLEEFIKRLKLIDSNFSYYYNVDTGPVMDKVWAVKAGVGWIGKNSNVINPKLGSFFFLATVFLDIEVRHSVELIANHCGSCTKCIDACPTKAIVEPYIIDSNKCISYLTIENKDETISPEFTGKFQNWAFGCDICQDVCPWNNKFSSETHEENFKNHIIENSIEFDFFEHFTNTEFNNRFKQSPIKRAKLKGMKRNLNHLKISNQIYKNKSNLLGKN